MQLVKDFFDNNQINPQILAVGVSGGADSLALALLLQETLPNTKIIALTVDHGLRPSSLQEATYVAKVMQAHNIEHHILTWDGDKPQTGIEEQARIARYNLLCTWCLSHQIEYLAVAHHLFDQAETFLMRLERGSGLFGLSAMQPISEKNGIKILRPLLAVHPKDLKQYLDDKKIPWVEDESNQCSEFLRVKMRHFLSALEEATGITPNRLCLAAENLQRTRKFTEYSVNEVLTHKVHFFAGCGASFDIAEFMSWHKELKFYIFSRLIEDITQNPYIPEAQSLNNLIQAIEQPTFSGATLGGIYFLRNDLRIWLIKENRHINTEITDAEWENYLRQAPYLRGIKVPAKLRQALLYEKNQKN